MLYTLLPQAKYIQKRSCPGRLDLAFIRNICHRFINERQPISK